MQHTAREPADLFPVPAKVRPKRTRDGLALFQTAVKRRPVLLAVTGVARAA